MKKLISLFLAVLFLLGAVPVSYAESTTFTGTVVDASDVGLSVTNEFGTTLTFVKEGGALELAAVGSTVTVTYTGDVTALPVAEDIKVEKAPELLTAKVTVIEVADSSFTASLEDGTIKTFTITGATIITGEAEALEAGQQVTLIYAENELGAFAANADITATALQTALEVASAVVDDTLNKKLSGTVYKLTSSRITIKTKKGKKWTFKITSKTKEKGKYALKVGATVTITYDGYASKKPAAKIIKVTKAAPDRVYKTKKGTCTFFGGMAIGVGSSFEADVAGAKHTGKGPHEEGTYVKVTYYTKNGCNYATKIKWYATQD